MEQRSEYADHRSVYQETPMRADAQKNYLHLLAVARAAIAEQGADASLRDIARRAGVGLATLYRHFPTREALLDALLRTTLDELTQLAADLEASASPDEALSAWLREAVAFVRSYGGVVDMMAAALEDDSSALHASCANLRVAGGRLLQRAQSAGLARDDLDGIDLFALIGALGWIGNQPAFSARADHLQGIIAGAILSRPDPAG
jgi:AcrR family transcriptional regulator